MSDLFEAARAIKGLQVRANNGSNVSEHGFKVLGKGERVVVYQPVSESWIDGRNGLMVRAERVQ
jgi:hypothetical protein